VSNQRFARFARGVAAVGLLAGTAATADAQSHASSSSGATVLARSVERQLPELETDRPDITEGSAVVGAGLWQLETGTLFQSDRHDPTVAHDVSLPNALLRLGLGDRAELRVGAEGFLAESLSTPGTHRASGLSDVELGVKFRVLTQEHHGVDLSLLPIISVPVGSDAFSTGGFDPTVKLTLSRGLPHGFDLGGNVIVSSITDDHSRLTQTALSASLGHGVGAGWSGFWEFYGASADSHDGGRAWLADTGVMHPIGHNLQVDVSVGRGLTEDAPDWFIGMGFAVRGVFKR
jgi:hypothetical protein